MLENIMATEYEARTMKEIYEHIDAAMHGNALDGNTVDRQDVNASAIRYRNHLSKLGFDNIISEIKDICFGTAKNGWNGDKQPVLFQLYVKIVTMRAAVSASQICTETDEAYLGNLKKALDECEAMIKGIEGAAA